MSLAVAPLTLEWWPTLENLFGRAGASNGCWCMYWRIGPRYRERPRAQNKHDLRLCSPRGAGRGWLWPPPMPPSPCRVYSGT
jgi:hypothetical protein